MAIKIALDAGHGLKTAGKQTPNGIKEWTLNDKVRDKVVALLSGYDVEFVFPDNNEGYTDESLTSRRTMYVNKGVAAAVSIHHNANTGTWNNATGVEVYTDRNETTKDRVLANAIYGKLVANTGLKGRGIKEANFTVVNQNSVPAVLVEGGFMDSNIDYPVITSDAGQTAYAKAIADGLIEFLGLKKKTSSTRSYLMKGDSGAKVKTMQANLIKVGYSCGNAGADGIFGNGTDVAVKRFQADYGLVADGKYGNGSKAKMTEILNLMKNPTKKYLNNGIYYDLVFNPTYYANHYSDLKAAFGTNAIKLFNHFMEFGIYEGRMGISYFNPNEYKNNYADLRATFGDDLLAYYKHYCEFGGKEGRSAV